MKSPKTAIKFYLAGIIHILIHCSWCEDLPNKTVGYHFSGKRHNEMRFARYIYMGQTGTKSSSYDRSNNKNSTRCSLSVFEDGSGRINSSCQCCERKCFNRSSDWQSVSQLLAARYSCCCCCCRWRTMPCGKLLTALRSFQRFLSKSLYNSAASGGPEQRMAIV